MSDQQPAERPAGPDTIRCPQCRRVSAHPEDLASGYCGYCADWTSPPRRATTNTTGQRAQP